MKILVLGGEGTIGTPLALELKRRGHEVISSDLQHGSNHYRCDISEYRQVKRLLSQIRPDMVYLMAAEFGRHNGEDFYEQCWKTNVVGGRNVMEMCAEAGTRLVFMSSSEVYGETPEAEIRECDTEQYPLRHHNDYAMSKWVNEQQIMNMERAKDLQCVRIRFFNAYGPGEAFHPYRSVVCLFCHAALHGLPYTVFRGYHRAFMYVDDAVETLANAAIRFTPGSVYNVGGEEYCSVERLDELIRNELGSAFRSDVQYLERDSHNTVCKRPNIELAKRDLSHNPTILLEEGLKRTLEWMSR